MATRYAAFAGVSAPGGNARGRAASSRPTGAGGSGLYVGRGAQLLVCPDDLLGHLDEVGQRQALVGAVRGAEGGRPGVAPDGQIAADRQDGHARARLVGPDQPPAEAAAAQHALELVHRLPRAGIGPAETREITGRRHPEREPYGLARDLPAAEP